MLDQTKLSSNKEVLAYLAEKFPLCFSLEGEARPLKIGIFQDLAEQLADDEKVSKTQLRQVLRYYTSNWRYLHGCRSGSIRVDLQGNDCGILEEEHVEHAAQQLKEAKAKVAERRAAQRAAQKQKRAENNKQRAVRPRKAVNKSQNNNKPKVQTKKLQSAVADTLKIGDKVQVKLGEQANAAIIVDTNGDAIRVQLHNGLTVNANIENIFVEA